MYSPSFVMVTSKVLTRPGMTSRLNRNAGTQNEWMTSGEVSLKRMVVSVGRTSCGGCPGMPVTETSSST